MSEIEEFTEFSKRISQFRVMGNKRIQEILDESASSLKKVEILSCIISHVLSRSASAVRSKLGGFPPILPNSRWKIEPAVRFLLVNFMYIRLEFSVLSSGVTLFVKS